MTGVEPTFGECDRGILVDAHKSVSADTSERSLLSLAVRGVPATVAST